jgi:hypothetical protein
MDYTILSGTRAMVSADPVVRLVARHDERQGLIGIADRRHLISLPAHTWTPPTSGLLFIKLMILSLARLRANIHQSHVLLFFVLNSGTNLTTETTAIHATHVPHSLLTAQFISQ